MQMSFGAMEIGACVGQDSTLLKAHALIDWEGLSVELFGRCKREASRSGRQKPIDSLTISKQCYWGDGIIYRTWSLKKHCGCGLISCISAA